MDIELISACYQVLLGRLPESFSAAESHASAGSYVELLTDFINCPEYKTRNDSIHQQIEAHYHAPPVIQYITDDETLQAMFARVQSEWTLLGDEEPFWSVLTDDRFKTVNIEENIEQFYSTGAQAAALLDIFGGDTGKNFRGGVCLELGCGVGRVTRHLAARFDKVIAVDVSSGNMDIAREKLSEFGVSNVEFILLKELKELRELPFVDFFYSIIAIQHNPPPIQYFIVNTLLRRLKDGGGALFQIAADMKGYQFVIDDYLESEKPIMEVHCLPMPAILDLAQTHAFRLLDIRPDNWVGSFGSYTFYGQKLSKRPRRSSPTTRSSV